jgi:hypothetical protein
MFGFLTSRNSIFFDGQMPTTRLKTSKTCKHAVDYFHFVWSQKSVLSAHILKLKFRNDLGWKNDKKNQNAICTTLRLSSFSLKSLSQKICLNFLHLIFEN